MGYRPSGPFTTAMQLFIPEKTKVKGVTTKRYPETGVTFFGSFRTFLGTERVVNDVLVIDDTATIETWYRSDINPDCKIVVAGTEYEIIGTPENIEMRNQFLLFKVRAIKGGA